MAVSTTATTTATTTAQTTPPPSPPQPKRRLSGIVKRVVRRVSSSKLLHHRRTSSSDVHVPPVPSLPLSPPTASRHNRSDSEDTAASQTDVALVVDQPILDEKIVHVSYEMATPADEQRSVHSEHSTAVESGSSDDRVSDKDIVGSIATEPKPSETDVVAPDAPPIAPVAEEPAAEEQVAEPAASLPSAPIAEAASAMTSDAADEEPDAPNPFIVDDSDMGSESDVAAPSDVPNQPAPSSPSIEGISADVSLSTTPAAASPAPLPSAPLFPAPVLAVPAPVNVNKSVPPTPSPQPETDAPDELSSSDEDEALEVYVTFPPPMFLPIPNVRRILASVHALSVHFHFIFPFALPPLFKRITAFRGLTWWLSPVRSSA
jgi:hypothetical protein